MLDFPTDAAQSFFRNSTPPRFQSTRSTSGNQTRGEGVTALINCAIRAPPINHQVSQDGLHVHHNKTIWEQSLQQTSICWNDCNPTDSPQYKEQCLTLYNLTVNNLKTVKYWFVIFYRKLPPMQKKFIPRILTSDMDFDAIPPVLSSFFKTRFLVCSYRTFSSESKQEIYLPGRCCFQWPDTHCSFSTYICWTEGFFHSNRGLLFSYCILWSQLKAVI